MKIVYLHQYFCTPEMMSGGIRSYEMARRLVAWGHEVHMVASDQSGGKAGDWKQTDENGIRVHWLPVEYHNSMSFSKRIRAFVKFAVSSARKAKSIDGDIVFATSTPLTIALPAVWAAKRRKRPMVFEVRDLWPEIPIAIGALKSKPMIMAARWLERFAYRNAKAVVALSPGMRDGIVKTGYPAEHVVIIPNAADLDFFDVPDDAAQSFRSKYEWLQDRPLVVYSGTFGFMNGVPYLAELAAKAREINPDIRFVAIGGGREHDQIVETATRLGVLHDNFHMLDRVKKVDMPAIYRAADMVTSLFIDLPEMQANSANKFFDGLASGTPIAINYGGWHKDLLEENGAGIAMDPEDHAAAAQQLVSRLTDASWLEQAGRNSRKLAEDQFARDDLTRKLEATLLEACGQSKPTS